MTISARIEQIMSQASWIRKMFEKGTRLKQEHGAENVFDFSLGNPNLSPPSIFKETLCELANTSVAEDHGYMPQAGYPYVRQQVADYLSKEHHVPVTGDQVLMTCGAAGALNVILKAILDPGDEVLIPSPFFMEYRFYTENHGGSIKLVPTLPDFSLDLAAMADAIGPNTKAVLINSPNNPTGQIYSQESLTVLGQLLTEKSRAFKRTIYLLSDEPYRKVVFGDVPVPSIFTAYPESLIATSYSKDLSMAGERIGFAAINPLATYKNELFAAMNLTNRILGFINAPALMQRLVARLQGVVVDVSVYERKRDLLCNGLADAGYEFLTPPGTFYLFPKSPIEDDIQFVSDLQKELVLVVPGSGFGGPGHFRIAYCVDDRVIEKSLPGFKRAMDKYR